MAKIDPETIYLTEDFECERCHSIARKVTKLESDVGYVNRKTGEFVPLCTNCWESLPDNDKAIRPVAEAIFLVIIRADGAPPIIMEDGIELEYKRSPTAYEIRTACDEVANNMDKLDMSERISSFLVQKIQQKQQAPPNLVLPRSKF